MRPRFLRSPALHFAVLGGAAYLLVAAWPGARPHAGVESRGDARAERTIVLDAPRLAALRDGWRAELGRPPSADEEAALVRRAVDDEILHREALRLIAGEGERPVRRRLVQLARLLALAPLDDDRALAAEAERLGFAASDPVIRRHLVETMRLALASPAAGEGPTGGDGGAGAGDPRGGDAALIAHRDAHPERFTEPERLRLTQVYLSRDRRPAVEADAARLLARLEDEAIAPAAATALGDPFVRGAHFELDRAALDRAFGPGFAAEAARAPVAHWSGPIASPYGLHLVWVHERHAPRLAPLEAVRGRLAHALRRAGAEERLARRLDALRAQYRITIDGADYLMKSIS